MTWVQILECDSCARKATTDDFEGMARDKQIENLYELDGRAFLVENPGMGAKVFLLDKDEAMSIAHSTNCAHVCATCMNDLPVKLFDKTEIPARAGQL